MTTADGPVRAAVLHGIEDLRVERFSPPRAAVDGAVLRVLATGVCGADPHAYYHGVPFFETPCVLGHEVVGVVEEIGPRARDRWGVDAGDTVVIEEYLPCGTCDSCLAGVYQMCVANARYGGKLVSDGSGLWGGYADVIELHPQSIVRPVPDPSVAPELYTLFVPISNGFHWVGGVGSLSFGDTVAVIGPGPHGLGAVLAASVLGARAVVAVGRERDATRLEIAKRLGAEVVIDRDDGMLADAVREATGGHLADVVVNAASSAGAFRAALDLAAPRGVVVQAGVGSDAVTVDPNPIPVNLLDVRGVLGRPTRLVRPTLELIASGRFPLEALCTHHFAIEDTERALVSAVSDPDVVKAVVRP